MIKLYVLNDEYLQVIIPKDYFSFYSGNDDFIKLNSEMEARDLALRMIFDGISNYFCFVDEEKGKGSGLITKENVLSLPYKYI